MEENRKYKNIFIIKVILVAVASAIMWLADLWMWVLVFVAFFPFVGIPAILAVYVIIGELFPKGRKGKSFFVRHIRQPLLLMTVTALTILAAMGAERIGERLEVSDARSAISRAEEILCYNDGEYHLDGIMGTELTRNSVLIDYDTMKLSFIFNGSFDKYIEVKLKKTAPYDSANIQTTAELKAPGKELIFFYPEKGIEYDHHTSAVQLTMADGTVYTAELSEDDKGFIFLGLKGTHLGEEERTWAEICGEE